MTSPIAPRIAIEELPALELLNDEELARIFGAGRFRPTVEGLESRDLLSAVLVVNTTQDVLGHNNGMLSLRQAILDANAIGGTAADPIRIQFDLPANDPNHFYYQNDGIAGKINLGNAASTSTASDSSIGNIDPDYAHSWWNLQPTSMLPALTTPTIVDGFSQPGARANDLAIGNNAVLPIVLDGNLIPKTGSTYGLHISGGHSTVQGLTLTRFIDGNGSRASTAIWFDTVGGNTAKGNIIGTDPSGLAAMTPTGGNLSAPSSSTMMGYGINFDRISNNLAGSDSTNNPADRNVIAATGYGIAVTGDGTTTGPGAAVGNVIAGNYLGTDRTGTQGLGNVGGIGTLGTVGLEIDGNLISGNFYGALITAQTVITMPDSGAIITSNYIGTDATGMLPIPNNRGLSFYGSTSHQVGAAMEQSGPEAAALGNLIAFNTSAAVSELDGSGYAANLISIRGNSIHDNGNAGIWLRSRTYAVPTLTTVIGGSTTTVTGTFTANPNMEYLVDFYANDKPDAGGKYEGQIYLGTAKITTDAAGRPVSSSDESVTIDGGNFTVQLNGGSLTGQVVTATLTDSLHNTSAFSPGVAIATSNPWANPVLVVNTTQDILGHDNGKLSLRQAILDANIIGGTAANPVQIKFDIPANDPGRWYYLNDGVAGQVSTSKRATTTAADDSLLQNPDPDWNHSWWSIKPTSLLPAITTPVVLDGYSQAGASKNTLANSDNAVIRVELDGDLLPLNYETIYTTGSGTITGLGGPSVLVLTGGDSTVSGLAINGLQAPVAQNGRVGVWLSSGSNNRVTGNFIGTDVSGTLAPNGLPDYSVGTHATSYGIHIADGSQHNFIGTDGDGVNDAAERNVISGLYWGVVFRGYDQVQSNQNDLAKLSGFNALAGNFIGTDRTGTKAVGNWIGVGTLGQAHDDRIGTAGTAPNAAGEGNVISGNKVGVLLGGGYNAAIDASHDYLIAGNKVGVAADGSPLGNTLVGIGAGFYDFDVQIGGTETVMANEIAYNGQSGIWLSTLRGAATGFTIRGNSIHDNGALGIDIGNNPSAPDGVTANDALDADSGPNALQNFPTLQSASRTMTSTTVVGTFSGAASRTLVIDFYGNTTPDANGYGEGRYYLGSVEVTTDGSGQASFTAAGLKALPANMNWIAATATDTGTGNTSEFSLNVSVPAAPVIVGTTVNVTGGTFTYDGAAHTASASLTAANGANLGSPTIAYFDAAGQAVATPVNVGTYTVVASYAGSPGYEASEASATIAITPAALTITVDDASRVYGQGNPEFTLNYSGFVNGENASVLQGVPAFATDATPSSNVGSYPVSVSGFTAANYDISFVAGNLSITPATLTATGTNITAKAGTAFTGVVASFPNADPFGTAASYTATITWGDGQTSTGIITPDGSGGFTVSGTNTFANAGTFATSVTITHALSNTTTAIAAGTAIVTPASTTANIHGTVYRDVTGNGLTADDVGWKGVKVYIDANNNGKLDSKEMTAVTNAAGLYAFTGLAPGTYTIREVLPAKSVRTAPTLADHWKVTVQAGDNVTERDFANFSMTGTQKSRVTKFQFYVNGKSVGTNLRDKSNAGDTVSVTFTVTAGAPIQVTLVSYTAPGPTFDPNTASQQTIAEMVTGTFGPGTYTLSVKNPNAYFQVDFVTGAAIDKFGPAGSNIFYSAQQRLISADNG